MQLTLVHMDMDSFFVSCERLHRPELVGKPLLIGGYGDRAVVSSASYEARKFGVRSAMPMRQALQLCPQAVVIRGDMDFYSQKSHEVTDIIAEEAPLYEKASIDEHYLDITGMDRFHGSYKWTHELRRRIIRETGLPISFGLSVNKTVAKMATREAKPNGELYVRRQELQQFMWPLSVRKIPGLGIKTYQELVPMGISTVGDLASMPREYMGQVFGKNGLALWDKANGIDGTPVLPYTEQKSMSREHTFGQDTIDPRLLQRTLLRMVEELGYELRTEGKLASKLTVKIRFADFETHTRDATIAYTQHDRPLYQKGLQLLHQLTQRRQLVRLVGIKVSGLVPGHEQLSLFGDTEREERLLMRLDRLRNKYGLEVVMRAATLELKQHEAEQKLPMRHLTDGIPGPDGKLLPWPTKIKGRYGG